MALNLLSLLSLFSAGLLGVSHYECSLRIIPCVILTSAKFPHSIKNFVSVYGCFACMCLCTPCVPGVQGSQKKALDTLEQELIYCYELPGDC